MTRETVKKIVRGITDKIEANTSDMDDWAEFWGFTVDEYEEFLDMPIKALEQEPKTGHWIVEKGGSYLGKRNGCCSNCKDFYTNDWNVMNYCPNCGAKMVEPQESEE